MRVLVCGGREYRDREIVFEELDRMHAREPITLLIEGGAPGADALAAAWAKSRRVPHLEDPANWERDGKAAGPIRNAKMLRDWAPDLVLAFPGGRGTDDMTDKAARAGVRTLALTEG